MIKKLLVGIALCLLPAVASADELSASFAPAAATNSPGTSNWTGGYAGLNFGVGVHDTFANDNNAYFIWGAAQMSEGGVSGGGTLGYNWQFSSSGVVGFEADINGASFDDRADFEDWEPGSGSFFRTEMPWFATFRARAGLAVGPALFYGTAGLALVELNQSACYSDPNCEDPNNTQVDAVHSTTTPGLAVGAGVEYVLPLDLGSGALSAKVEYLYINTPTKRVGDGVDFDDCDQCSVNYKSDTQLVRLGVNYHF